MAEQPPQDDGLTGAMRRVVGGARDAVDGAVEATVGRVGHTVGEAAMDVTNATAQQVIEEIEPYLVEHAIPRILAELQPYLDRELVPRIVDGLLPHLEQEIAPRLVDSLLPKIRRDVVPLILDDIVDDPRVRDLIREQSQGLFLDALESVRENLADGDVLAERFGRRLVRKPPRPEAASGVDLVLEAGGGTDTTPARLTRANLAEQRRAWQEMPIQPAPPGREFSHAGVVTRLVGFTVDVGLVGWLLSQGLSALIGLLDSILTPVPPWLAAGLTGLTIGLFPMYLAVSWWLTGRTVGSWLVGTRVCTPDGRNPGLLRALVRGWVGVLGIAIWVLTGVFSLLDPKRRTYLDRMAHTEVRYVVPDDQQRRYIREALLERRAQEAA